MTHAQKIYYIKDVEEITGRSRMTLRRWWLKGKFPMPAILHGSRLAWSVKDIEKWINEVTA